MEQPISVTSPSAVTAWAVPGLGEIKAGDDLASAITDAVADTVAVIAATDVVVVSHKAISKAEGRVVALGSVRAGEHARTLAAEHGKDAQHMQVVLDETRRIVRAERGVLICETHHGFVCANAGVDRSNTAEANTVVLLPIDPDGSARRLRERLRERLGVAPAVIIADSWGRPWRHGQTDVAIGVAGIDPLDDWRGRDDRGGRPLQATLVAHADQLTAAADLARGGKTSGNPVMVVSDSGVTVTDDDGPGITPILRAAGEDLFR